MTYVTRYQIRQSRTDGQLMSNGETSSMHGGRSRATRAEAEAWIATNTREGYRLFIVEKKIKAGK
jgi:hypothetical protein